MDPTAIANLALGWLGCDPVLSFDEPASKTEQLLHDQFAGLRDTVLEDGDWTFAMARLVAQRDAAPPAFGFPSRYLLPATVIRVVSAQAAGAGATIDAFALSTYPSEDDGLLWEREGRYVLADTKAAQLNVKAIVQVDDPGLWSPSFCQALAARIASDLCIPITQDRALSADMWKLYGAKLITARANDGRQGRSQRRSSDSIQRQRR